MKNEKKKVRTTDVKKDPEKKDHKDYKYDPSSKSWRGPVVGQQLTLPITRHHCNREKQWTQQVPENVKVNKKVIRGISTPDVDFDRSDDSDDAESVVQDVADMQHVNLNLPFADPMKLVKPSWEAPMSGTDNNNPIQDKLEHFSWNKPSSKEPIHVTAQQHMLQLEKQLVKKGDECELLREQLAKAHRENYKLTQQLNGYTGKHYKVMEKENTALRNQVARLQRQNIKLECELKRDTLHSKHAHSDDKLSSNR